MKITIDAAGRLVLPKAIRDRLGLRGGELLEVSERDGIVEIALAPADIRLVERDGVLVATADLPPLTEDAVRSALEGGRR